MRGLSARQAQAGQTHRASDAPQRQRQEKLSSYDGGDDAGTTPSPAIASTQPLNLARASDGPTAAQRTRPHPEARRQGRRHIVKGSAAIAATILRRAFHAQPVAARRTTRIQTLHGPTGQILHSFASQTHGPGGGRGSEAAEAPRLQKRQELAGLCAGGSSESRQIYTISSGAVAKLWKIRRAQE
jgi:hypothetical protein